MRRSNPFLIRIFSLGLLTLVTACDKIRYQDVDLSSSQEKSCGFVQNSNGYRVSWQPVIPVKFYLESGVPEEYRGAIRQAAADWNEAFGKNIVTVEANVIISSRSSKDLRNTIYWVSDESQFGDFEQAKTIIRWSRAKLIDADILINANRFPFFTGDTSPQVGSVHLESLLVHELGHGLGLGHVNVIRSVMFPYLDLDSIRKAPYEDPDVNGLGCEYL